VAFAADAFVAVTTAATWSSRRRTVVGVGPDTTAVTTPLLMLALWHAVLPGAHSSEPLTNPAHCPAGVTQ
jgi:hypothetical protein